MEYKSSSIQKQCIKGTFALVIYLGLILTFAFGAFTPHKTGSDKKSKAIELEGTIGRYPIQMFLNLKDIKNYDTCEVTGKYRYTASGDGGMLNLNGEKKGDNLVLKEYDSDNHQTGTFNGTFEISDRQSSFEYTGTFTNAKGKNFKFSIKSK